MKYFAHLLSFINQNIYSQTIIQGIPKKVSIKKLLFYYYFIIYIKQSKVEEEITSHTTLQQDPRIRRVEL